MMRVLGIIILVILFFWFVWPSISRWLKRKAIEKTQEYFWRKMGMPPPGKDYDNRGKKGRNQKTASPKKHEPIIPKEYAEDVEFTETLNYSQDIETHRTYSEETYHESQISDAEWTEIKSPGTK